MTTACVLCDRPTTHQTHHTCESCTGMIRDQLHTLAWLAQELEVTLTRRDRLAGNSGHRTNGTTPLPYHPGAQAALESLCNTLFCWALAFADKPTSIPTEARGLTRWLASTEAWRHPAAAKLHANLAREIDRALQVINPDHRATYGQCGTDTTTGPCQEYLYGDRDAAWVRCPRCGTQHDTHTRRQAMLTRLRTLYLPPATIARIVPTWLGRAVPESSVRHWAATHPAMRTLTDSTGRIIYHVGDVMDVAGRIPARHRTPKESPS